VFTFRKATDVDGVWRAWSDAVHGARPTNIPHHFKGCECLWTEKRARESGRYCLPSPGVNGCRKTQQSQTPNGLEKRDVHDVA